MTEQNITTEIINGASERKISPSSSRILKRPLSPEDSDEGCADPTRTKETDPQKGTNGNVAKPKKTANATKTDKRLKHQGSTSVLQPQQQCQHPKHEVYLKLTESKLSRKSPAKADGGKSDQVVSIFKRLEGVFDLGNGALMCKRCLRQTDRDPEYTSNPKYISARSIFKKNERARLVYEMKGIDLIDLD